MMSIRAMRWAKRGWSTPPDTGGNHGGRASASPPTMYTLLAFGTGKQVHVVRFQPWQGKPHDRGEIRSGSFRPEDGPPLSFDCDEVSALEWVPLSHGGDGLAVGTTSGSVLLVDLSKDHREVVGKLQEIYPPDQCSVTSLVCSEPLTAGEIPMLATAKASFLWFYDVDQRRSVGGTIHAHLGEVTAMAWSCGPEGGKQYLISGGLEGSIKVCSLGALSYTRRL